MLLGRKFPLVHHDLAAFVRPDKRWRARGREISLLQLASSDNQRSRGWPNHAGVAVPIVLCLVVCLGALRSVPVRRYKVGACAAWCPSTDPHPSRGHRDKFGVRTRSQTTATPAPGYSISSSSFVTVDPSSMALACSGEHTLFLQWQDAFLFEFQTSAVLLQKYNHPVRNCKRFLILLIVLIPQQSLHFRTYWKVSTTLSGR